MDFSVDGRQVHAYTGGKPFDAARPAVVFVHGSGCDHTVWILQSRYFAHHERSVLAVDLPGHGQSAGPALDSIEAMADWLLRVLDTTGLQQVTLVGHSMGSLVSLDFALRHGGRIERLALLGSAAPMPVAKALLSAAAVNDHASIDMITLWGHSYPAQLGGNTVPGMWMTGAGVRLLERAKPGVLHTDLAACNAYGELNGRGTVHCPALMLSGNQDMMTPPRASRAMMAHLPEGRFEAVTNCGHMMMAEQPDRVLDALVEFLGTSE